MNIFKIVIKQCIESISKTILFILIVILLASLMLFAVTDIEITLRGKLVSIEQMPKTHLILDNGVFRGNETFLINNYEVSFYRSNYLSTGQSIQISVVSDNFFSHGIPFYYEANSPYRNVFETNLLYGDLDITDIENPIVIDETTALKRYQRLNAVNEQMILIINNQSVVFNVVAIIKETPERLNNIQYALNHGVENPEDYISFSNAYIFDSSFTQITGSTMDYTTVQIIFDNPMNEHQIKAILTDLDIDLKEEYYTVHSYLLYKTEILENYKNSILSNIIILSVVAIAFTVIFIINLMHGLKKNKQDISYMKSIGVSKKTQLQLILTYWLTLIYTGMFISAFVSLVLLYVTHNKKMFDILGIYSIVFISLSVALTILSLLSIVPLSNKFINNTPNTLFRMDDEN